MANITITNNDLDSPVLESAEFRDEVIEFGGADVLAPGTIMARQVVDLAVANGVADGGNTGNGTVTLVTVVPGPKVPIAGAYVLTLIEAITEGGVFKLVDPNGAIVDPYILIDDSGEAATVVETGGLQFTITEGATDFAVGDFFTITVVANGDLVPYDPAGAGGAQVPLAILTYEVVATGVEDIPARVGVSGKYRKEKLVIDGGGSVNNAVTDQLRVYGLVPVDVTELNIQDNQ